MFAPLSTWQLVGVILASAFLWMHYVNLKDHRQPEPRRQLLLAFGLGVVAWGLAVLGFLVLDACGLPDIQFGERRWTAVYCFLFIGPIEEGAKALLAYAVVFRWRVFDETIDGFVYAAAISLGFASVENFYNMPNADWLEQLARTAALPITHTLFSAIWGFGAGYARFHVPPGARRLIWQTGTLVLGAAAHGLHDYVIFAYQATFLTSGLALVIWVFVIWRAKVCLKHQAANPNAERRAG